MGKSSWLTLSLVVAIIGCPAPTMAPGQVANEGGPVRDGRSSANPVSDDDVRADAGTLTDRESRRLALKVVTLTELVREIESVRAEIKDESVLDLENVAHKQRAAEKGFSPIQRERALARAAESVARDDGANIPVDGPVLPRVRLKRLAARGEELLSRETAADDDKTRNQLRKTLRELQTSAAPIVAAAHIAAQSLFRAEVARRSIRHLGEIDDNNNDNE